MHTKYKISPGINRWWLFLLGLGASTKVYMIGVIAISEIVVFALAPFLFVRIRSELKREGFMPILTLAVLLVLGNAICVKVNHVPISIFVKDCATYYSVFAFIVCFYFLLRKDLKGVGWFYLGAFISSIISIFALNPQVTFDGGSGFGYMSQLSVEDTMSGVMFWYHKVFALVKLPIRAVYMHLPLAYTLIAFPASVVFTVLISTSGRSASALTLLSCALIVVARRSRRSMYGIGKHFGLCIVAGLVLAVGIKNLYVVSARNGWLGARAQTKYYQQMKAGTGLLGILMGGRSEFFIALRACFDDPLIGQGAGAKDEKGYVQDMVMKYGNLGDIERFKKRLVEDNYEIYLPQHSCITMFWSRCGIVGLIFWLYVLYLFFMYFKKYAGAIPHWFGFLAVDIVSFTFTIFFNPYTSRISTMLVVTCVLLARSVYLRKRQLPFDLEMEARRYE